jgi:hypothetical protein
MRGSGHGARPVTPLHGRFGSPEGAFGPIPEDPRSEERSGAFVVRAWREKDGGFRARVRASTDLGIPEERLSLAAGPGEVEQELRRWLLAFLSD